MQSLLKSHCNTTSSEDCPEDDTSHQDSGRIDSCRVSLVLTGSTLFKWPWPYRFVYTKKWKKSQGTGSSCGHGPLCCLIASPSPIWLWPMRTVVSIQRWNALQGDTDAGIHYISIWMKIPYSSYILVLGVGKGQWAIQMWPCALALRIRKWLLDLLSLLWTLSGDRNGKYGEHIAL